MQYRDRKAGRIAEIDYTCLRDDTDHPYRLQCEQFKLTAWCYEQLAKIPGAELHFAHEMTGLMRHDDHVAATVATPTGDRQFTGRYLIGADGGRSVVRKLLGIPFEGYTHPEQFLVAGTHYDFKAKLKDICSVNYTADPDEWFLLLEIPDMWRIVMPVGPSVEAEDAIADDYLQNALQNICPREGKYEILVRAIYRVHQRVADSYRKGRVFLAGDAAHLNNPLGGMGLNGGLHDAVNLTRRLSNVWHGTADERTLDGYEAQRRPAAIKGVNSITERNKRLMEERDPAVQRARLEELVAVANDPAKARQHVLNTSMNRAASEQNRATSNWPYVSWAMPISLCRSERIHRSSNDRSPSLAACTCGWK